MLNPGREIELTDTPLQSCLRGKVMGRFGPWDRKGFGIRTAMGIAEGAGKLDKTKAGQGKDKG